MAWVSGRTRLEGGAGWSTGLRVRRTGHRDRQDERNAGGPADLCQRAPSRGISGRSGLDRRVEKRRGIELGERLPHEDLVRRTVLVESYAAGDIADRVLSVAEAPHARGDAVQAVRAMT